MLGLSSELVGPLVEHHQAEVPWVGCLREGDPQVGGPQVGDP